jgi:hypothetical protein
VRFTVLIFVLFFGATSSFAQIDTLYYFDFSNGLPVGWNNLGENSLGNDSACSWEYRGPNTNPSITEGSVGSYSKPNDPIRSFTRHNGFFIYDSDYLSTQGLGAFFGGPCNAPHIGKLVTYTLNFDSIFNVALSFESYFRNFHSQPLIEISYDGGVSFSDSILIYSTPKHMYSDNPTHQFLDLTNLVAGKKNVVLSFTFDGMLDLSTPSEQGYFFWMIDDVALLTGGYVDGRISKANSKEIIYSKIPYNRVKSRHFPLVISNNSSYTDSFSLVEHLNQGTTLLFDTIFNSFDTVVLSYSWLPDSGMGKRRSKLELETKRLDPLTINNVFHDSTLITDSTFRIAGPSEGFFYLDYSVDFGAVLSLFNFNDSISLSSVKLDLVNNCTGLLCGTIVVYKKSSIDINGQSNTLGNALFESPFFCLEESDYVKKLALIPARLNLLKGEYYIGIKYYGIANPSCLRLKQDVFAKVDLASSIHVFGGTVEQHYINAFGLELNVDSYDFNYCDSNELFTTILYDEVNCKYYPLNISGGEAPYNYTWFSDVFGIISTDRTASISWDGKLYLTIRDANNCVFRTQTTSKECNKTNVELLSNTFHFEITPNPAQNKLNLSSNEQLVSYSIYTIQGKKLNQKATKSKEVKIPINHLSKGVYFIQAEFDDGSNAVKKFVVY